MLRASDFLLTLAAFFLLNAALNSSSRHKGAVIVASAAQVSQELVADAKSQQRKSDTPFNLLMHKIKRNLEKSQADIRPSSADPKSVGVTSQHPQKEQQAKQIGKLENSYNYYANETATNLKAAAAAAADERLADQPSQHRAAHEVQVKLLRSLAGTDRDAAHQASKSNATDTLYLLTYLAATSSAPQADSSNEIDVGEQQQAPLASYPPMPAQPNGQQNQLQENLRQILNNYQRYPQTGGQVDEPNRLLSQQMAPRPNQPAYQSMFGNLFPALQAPAAQPSQPISPLQLITAPFQAFLPGLTPQPPPATNQQAHQQGPARELSAGQPPKSGRPRAPKRAQPGQPISASVGPPASPLPPPPSPPSTPPSAAAPGQMGGPVQPQLPSLQAIYQQLPLYQALLAARQRQEALDAAQKLRQRQQQPASGLPAGLGALGLGQQLPGSMQPQLAAGLPPLALAPPPSSQPPAPPSLSNSWQVQPPPFIPHQANQLAGQVPALQQVAQPTAQPIPVEPTRQPVQFDDDNDSNPAKPNDQSRPGENNEPPGDEQPHEQGGNEQAQPEQDSNNEEAPNEQQQPPANEPESEQANNPREPDRNEPTMDPQQGSGPNDSAGQSPGSAAPGPTRAEEEDPDLKQFQNLANGGDSFTDLFPPGILSNNDINEIKSQQEEQARKQEQEERQRQLRNQRNQQEGNSQTEPAGDQAQQDDNNNDGSDEQPGGSDDEARLNGPMAAALITAKSSPGDSSTTARAKLTSSPGVVYAN